MTSVYGWYKAGFVAVHHSAVRENFAEVVGHGCVLAAAILAWCLRFS